MAEIQKPADQAEQKAIQKTPEAAAVSGVVAAQPNQDVFGEAKTAAHANDKTLSEPDMIALKEGETVEQYKARVAQIQANRFGFYDSEAEASTKVFEKPAKQAVEPMPALAPVLSEGPYNSTVKLNVQITNVPEVSEGVKPEDLLQYTDTMLQSGAQAVRQIETHMAEPNAINSDMANMAMHFSQSPYQLNRDVQAVFNAVVEQIDHPMDLDERARAAGNVMPMFFFEGNAAEPISPQTVEQMGLETLSQEELNSLGMSRLMPEVSEFRMPETPEHLRHLEVQKATPELLQKMTSKGREIVIVEPGSDEFRYLMKEGLEGSAGNADLMHILLRPEAKKITALEEFLHGTQARIGVTQKVPREIVEYRVKDFMIRHSQMLGLGENDVLILEALREREALKARRWGYPSELFRVGTHE